MLNPSEIPVKPELAPVVAQNAKVTEALTKEEAVQADTIVKFCKSLIQSAKKQAQVYYDLVTYIRENKVAPRLVSAKMVEMGFNKVRASEVNRVANAPEALYNQFAARALGFKNVLQLVRGSDATTAKVTPAGQEILGSDATGATALEAEAQVEETMTAGGTRSGVREAKSDVEKLVEAAAKVLALIEAQAKRLPWTTKSSNGLLLTVVRMKPLTKKTAGSARLANLGPVASRPSALKLAEAEERLDRDAKATGVER